MAREVILPGEAAVMLPASAHLAEPVVIVDVEAGPRAWTPNVPSGTWPAAALPLAFYVSTTPSRDVGAAAGAELDVALRTWSHVACTSFRGAFAGASAAAAGDDGVNAVYFHDDAWPPSLDPGAIAQTVIHVDASGSYHDADIHVNGAAFRFSLDGAPDGTIDLRSVLVHELGHALGLGHSTDPRATMFPTISGLRCRSLEKDDVSGVCTLYPGSGAPGCDALACPAGFVCVAGSCERPRDRADVCSPCARVDGACEAAGDDARCVDLPGGRVCGRTCAADADCGGGFHCKPTSAAGDLQCVSDDACRSAAWPCAIDADCTNSGTASVCSGGACVGVVDRADGGADASRSGADATPDASSSPVTAGGGGCSCGAAAATPAPTRGSLAPLAALAVVVARRIGRRRRST